FYAVIYCRPGLVRNCALGRDDDRDDNGLSPELSFLVTLGLRMAIAAAFVVSASIVTERSGPVIGALVATLPISAGPSYVFLALDHDAAFIAEGALASLPINAATIFLGLTYAVLAQKRSALVSCGAAVV